jgi:hypothetical protein
MAPPQAKDDDSAPRIAHGWEPLPEGLCASVEEAQVDIQDGNAIALEFRGRLDEVGHEASQRPRLGERPDGGHIIRGQTARTFNQFGRSPRRPNRAGLRHLGDDHPAVVVTQSREPSRPAADGLDTAVSAPVGGALGRPTGRASAIRYVEGPPGYALINLRASPNHVGTSIGFFRTPDRRMEAGHEVDLS